MWWNGQIPDPLRTAWPNGAFSGFYDIQARALGNGHWWVPKGSLGIEAFVVDGKEFMYFGPFASLLRAPVLALTHDLDSELTAPSMLLSWAVTATFLPLLVWRIRVLTRGQAVLSRAETVSLAVVIATVLGGSVLVFLAALPWVYHEDFSWSVALTTGVLFTLIGVLERPTTWRVVATGVLTTAAVLNRATTGWACVIAVGLAAIWFATGSGGADRRHWWRGVLAAALLPLAVGCAVTWAKFGTPFGLPMSKQIFTSMNAHRREFLAANGGRAFSPEFLPSTLLAYLRPDGLRLSLAYPFISLPSEAAKPVGDVVLDQTYRTGSIPATMPLLFGLAVWGIASLCRRGLDATIRLLRIPMLGAAAASVGVLVWGYIANRYLADFLPLLIMGATVGVVAMWRRLDGRGRRPRVVAVGVVVALGVFGVLANLAIVSAPPTASRGVASARDYVELRRTIGDFIGNPVTDDTRRGPSLPRPRRRTRSSSSATARRSTSPPGSPSTRGSRSTTRTASRTSSTSRSASRSPQASVFGSWR